MNSIILVVDSDLKHINLMRHILAPENYNVLAVRSGERAVEITASEQPALIFLEIKLEGALDGIGVARHIHDFSDVPIIFVSSSAEPEDILRAFNAGADDYITKPFHGGILLARMHAVLDRYKNQTSFPCQTEVNCGNLKIDIPRRQVMLDGIEVYLSETEFNLLLELAKNQGQVLLHDQLLTSVWGPKYRQEIDYLRSYIHMLRRKLESKPQHPRLIISKPGVGYMLVSESISVSGE
ncbi:MAG: response regulator transcription factor [Leptolinea sp.]